MRLPLGLLSMTLLLAGCDRPPQARAPAPGDSAMEFRGERPCADCEWIRASLRLESTGGGRRYRLVELYGDGAGGRRFEDSGEWTARGDLLRLASREGGERVYARRGDGSLQARASDGGRLPGAEDEVLRPTGFEGMR